VVETNYYYHDYLDRLDNGPSPDPDVTEAKMFVSGIDNTDGTWHKRQTDRLLVNIRSGIHTFLWHYDEPGQKLSHPSLRFTDNRNEPDKTNKNFDWLWKIRDLFEILNDTFSKFYNLSENLGTDEFIVPFNGRMIFKEYISKNAFRHQNVQTF